MGFRNWATLGLAALVLGTSVANVKSQNPSDSTIFKDYGDSVVVTAPLEKSLNTDNFPMQNSFVEYSEDLERISKSVYCIRNTAVYGKSMYTDDGKSLEINAQGASWGTAYAFKRQDGFTYLLTNYHVIFNSLIGGWDREAKLTKEKLEVVDNIRDDFKEDDIPLELVASAPEKDVALIRTKAELPFYEPQILVRDSLKERDKTILIGYPLGETKTVTEGIVGNVYDPDREYDRDMRVKMDHVDFIVDCASNPGNSGSPAFVIRNGEYYFEGLLHEGYGNMFSQAEGLKRVIGVDEFSELMKITKVQKKHHKNEAEYVNEDELGMIRDHLRKSDLNRFFNFANDGTRIDVDGQTIKFTLYGPYFLNVGDMANKLVLVDNGQNRYGGFDHVSYLSEGETISIPSDQFDDNQKILFGELERLLFENFLGIIRYREAYEKGFNSKNKKEEAGRTLSKVSSNLRLESVLKRSAIDALKPF